MNGCLSGAERVTDTDFVLTHTLDGQIFTECAVPQFIPVSCLPPGVMLSDIDTDRSIFPSVVDLVSLPVSVEVVEAKER